jgi:PAS domain S-box-containing protein
MLFINTSGQVVFAKAYDLDNMTDVPVPQSLLPHLTANDTLLHHESLNSSIVGTLLLPEGSLLIASRPILTSLGQGPIQGTLITGRFLDSIELNFLFKTTHLLLAVQTIADSPISSDFQTANSSLSKKSPMFIQPLSTERIAGYALLEDIYGTPILIFRADMPRDFYAQSQTGILYTALFLIVIGVAFGLLTMLLLEKLVISRLTRLNTDVYDIGRSGNPSARVSEIGNDELSSLGGGINKMISALGQTQENLKKTAKELQRFSCAVKASLDGIVVSDMNGKIIDLNDATATLYGFDNRSDLIGKSAFDLVDAEEREKISENMIEVLKEGRAKSREITATTRSGVRVQVEISTTLMKNEEGHPVGLLAIIRDVTERRQLLQKLEGYSEQLEKIVEQRTKQLKGAQEQLVKSERLAAIGQVAAMVGHDLRNPLTGISGAAYYLKMKLGPKAEKRMIQMLEIIEKDIQYSNKIITDLMEYSKEIKLELTETTPKSIIAESISLIQIPEKVQLADSTLNEPRIKMDFDKMKRVFANFIKNAVEAMPQEGKLTISSRASKSDVELTFVDTGAGMAKEVLEKIWTPFFTTKAKGMGLGLAICRRIIEAHQGKISVESIFGEGTTFTITIPIEPKPRVEGGEKVWVNMPESLLSTTTKA